MHVGLQQHATRNSAGVPAHKVLACAATLGDGRHDEGIFMLLQAE